MQSSILTEGEAAGFNSSKTRVQMLAIKKTAEIQTKSTKLA